GGGRTARRRTAAHARHAERARAVARTLGRSARRRRLSRRARTPRSARRLDPLVLPVVRKALHLGHVLCRRAGADLAAWVRSAARERLRQRRGRTRAGPRAGGTARISPAGHA